MASTKRCESPACDCTIPAASLLPFCSERCRDLAVAAAGNPQAFMAIEHRVDSHCGCNHGPCVRAASGLAVALHRLMRDGAAAAMPPKEARALRATAP